MTHTISIHSLSNEQDKIFFPFFIDLPCHQSSKIDVERLSKIWKLASFTFPVNAFNVFIILHLFSSDILHQTFLDFLNYIQTCSLKTKFRKLRILARSFQGQGIFFRTFTFSRTRFKIGTFVAVEGKCPTETRVARRLRTSFYLSRSVGAIVPSVIFIKWFHMLLSLLITAGQWWDSNVSSRIHLFA